MGIIQSGVPIDKVLFLKNKMNLGTFVEGGTFTGGTATEASKLFDNVITIEKSSKMLEIAKKNLQSITRITLLAGDTREHLPKILQNNNNIIFWLDAHWSGSSTYGEGDECPLIEELALIFNSGKKCAILIDDARLFLAPPPLPHVLESWPTITKIVKCIPNNWEIFVFEDVIYLLPESIVTDFRNFLQGSVTAQWKNQARKKSILVRILGKLGFNI